MKLAFILTSFLATAATAQDEYESSKTRSLTLEEFISIAVTAVEDDFEYSQSDTNRSSAYWESAVAYEWSKNLAGENVTGDKYPFILCNSAPGLSGYQRITMLAESFPDVDGLNDTKVMINTDERMCQMAHILPSQAMSIEGEDFAVQPHMASMKMVGGRFPFLPEEIETINSGNRTDFVKIMNVVLCPGVNIETEHDGAFNEVWTENLTSRLVNNIYPSEVSESYYFTSQAYIESDLATTMNQTERSLYWTNILDTYQKDDTCNDVFENRLLYSFLNFGQDPWVEVRVNTTGVTEHDLGCILTLTLAISTLSTVCAVEVVKSPKPLNVAAQWVIQSGKESSEPFYDVGLDGTGQVVSVSDTGIDKDNCYFWDVNRQRSEKIDLDNRKVVQYVEYENDSDTYYGHGTHVAGIIAGKRAVDGETESNGAADGVAPGAKLAFADLGDRLGMIYIPTYEELLSTGRPYAQIHSMSWGVDINLYTTETKIFDGEISTHDFAIANRSYLTYFSNKDFMFDNDEFLIVVAAGNIGEGNNYNTVGEPATGKNIIAVGSHHNGGNSAPRGSKGIDYASGFSSRGPTHDGRQKPDVLAPGHFILSAGAKPNDVGECDPTFGTVKPGEYGDGLLSMEGTSMAAPALAGAASIVRQYFNDGFYPSGKRNSKDIIDNPSSALIKGVIMNGAQYVAGVDNVFAGITPVAPYDETQNFGRISLKDSLYISGQTDVQLQLFDREEIVDKRTKTYNFTIDKSQGCKNSRFSVTLIWNEPGSIPGCMRCLINNLDMRVVKVGATQYPYFPNGLAQSDNLNNNERVIIEDVTDGDEFTVIVDATNLGTKKTKYSLISTGCYGGVGIGGGLSESEKFASGGSNVDSEESVHDKEAGVQPKSNGSPISMALSTCVKMSLAFFAIRWFLAF